MDYEFLTLLKDNNDWIDWCILHYGKDVDIEERPKEFPCYVGDECIGWEDKEVEGDCKGEPLFWPTFLYLKDVGAMLDNLEQRRNVMLTSANELLRSAYEIAKRKGTNTNWEAFENNLRKELLKQAGVPDSTDEQTILRAICTAKTYRTFGDEQ